MKKNKSEAKIRVSSSNFSGSCSFGSFPRLVRFFFSFIFFFFLRERFSRYLQATEERFIFGRIFLIIFSAFYSENMIERCEA